MENQIIIPISPTHPDEQLQSMVMALIHAYGLTAVLDAMHEGLLTHYDESRMEPHVQRPILDSINVASVITDQLLKEDQADD